MRGFYATLTALVVLLAGLLLAPGTAYAACSGAGTAGDDVIVCDGTTPNKVFGLDGNDSITNNGTISSGGIDGGSGNDTIVNNGFISASVDGGPSNDIIINEGNLAGGFGLDGGSGANTIYNNGSVDFIIAGGGGAGTVIIGLNADGQAGINGDGDDTLCFNNGADISGKNPAGDSVTVGAETFTWNNFGTLATDCAVPGAAPGDDERLNPAPGAPVVVWCRPDGVDAYTVDRLTSEGVFAFTASPAAVAQGLATARATNTNTAIQSGGGATLYALSSGELQVNAFLPTGEIYAFIFEAAACQQAFRETGSTSTQGSTAPTLPGVSLQPGFDVPITGDATYHVVQRGETLYRIARRYGMTWPELASVNGIDDGDVIYAGQILYIPPR